MNTDLHLSRHYPLDIAEALQNAQRWWPADTRLQRIDELTDELVKRGLARPRNDAGVFQSIAQERAIAEAAYR